MKDSYLEYFEISRLLTISDKNLELLLFLIQFELILLIQTNLFLVMTLSDYDGFIVFQKS